MDLPGANQMKFARNLIEAFPLTERVPDQSIIVENNYAAAERIQATRGQDYMLIYSAAGKPFTVKPGKIRGNKLKCYWYNPGTGKTTRLDGVSNSTANKFSPPSSGYGRDWVLVLHDAGKNYELPGLE
jgi:hypothetical protein